MNPTSFYNALRAAMHGQTKMALIAAKFMREQQAALRSGASGGAK